MQSNSLRKEVPIIRQLKTQPYVTLLLTFEPKLTPKYVLENNLKTVIEKVKNELFENYSIVTAKEVSNKLVSVVSNLDYNTHKRSIAILVSSDQQKIYYRDVRVDDKFIISNAFQYRDLVYYKKKEKEYLLLVLDSKQGSVYRGKGETLTRILLNVSDHKGAFIESVDRNLSLLLNAFPFPVFVLGSENILREYRRITTNGVAICNYIEETIDDATEDDMEKIVEPIIKDWSKVKETYLVQKLEGEIEQGKVAVGIQEVWKLAKRKNIKHLVIEEMYEYHAYLGKGLIVCAEEATSNSYIKDAVEDIIDMVLADGGDIDFVPKGCLNDFMHIAAIRNY